jgi:hypothetical protein
MPSPEAHAEVDGQVPSASAELVGKRIRDLLDTARHRINEEIRTYPRPIAGCDLQFNHLLEERTGIADEVARLHEDLERARAGSEPLEGLKEFIRSSAYLDEEAKREMMSSLGAGLANSRA